jgi:hypothetical protein
MEPDLFCDTKLSIINNDYRHTTKVWNYERGVFPSRNYPIQDRSQLFSLVWIYIQSKQGYSLRPGLLVSLEKYICPDLLSS